MTRRQADFGQLLKVLRKQKPDRPTLFEFFLNQPLYERLAGEAVVKREDPLRRRRIVIRAFHNAGYDYATLHPPDEMTFAIQEIPHGATISLNDYGTIFDRASFDAYRWPVADTLDYSVYDAIAKELPDGMKAIVCGPGGVLENVIRLVGYEKLCFMLAEDPALAKDIFDKVGEALCRHYALAVGFDSVGAIISNDDWGFNTQTMLSPETLREYVFPWHKKIAAIARRAGKPAILHSCGNLKAIMGDIVDDMKYDAKHSYEDNIQPVEEAYEELVGKIAVVGGLDLDFVCRRSPEEIACRAKKMLARAADRGGYALGTGNSVPEYVPTENYFAMTSAALDVAG